MSMVGFCGGCTMYEVGLSQVMENFFEALRRVLQSAPSDMDRSLVLDRLYKRYVRFEDIDKTKKIMDYCKAGLIDVGNIDESNGQFIRYFRSFESCLSSAIHFRQAFGDYQPIKIAITDLPWCILEGQRSLHEYDQLEDKPFWLRAYTEEEIDRLSNL